MSGDSTRQAPSRQRGVIKSPQDFAAGIFLLVIAGIAFIGGWKLSMGTMSGVGPGMLPKVVAAMVAGFGVLLILQSLKVVGQQLDAWSIRGLIFILSSLLVFAATVRTLGLAFSGPLAVIISAFAEKHVRIKEIIIYALVLTGACIVLFKYMLKLPIPILPDNFPLPF